MKSKAPFLIASTAVSTLPCAVMTITGVASLRFLAASNAASRWSNLLPVVSAGLMLTAVGIVSKK